MKPILINPGDKYKNWLVVKRVNNYKRERAYLCRCKCGVEKVLPSSKLRSLKESFACKECSYDMMKKHGDSQQSRRGKRHPLFVAWNNMIRRCEKVNHPSYHLYGARGINVCVEWHEYTVFKAWALDNGWKQGLSLDRINNEMRYTPSNCRWVTQKTQARNSRQNHNYTIDGRTQCRQAWLEEYGVSDWFVNERIKKFNVPFEEAIKIPRRRTNGDFIK